MESTYQALFLLLLLIVGLFFVLMVMAFFAHAPVLCASFVGIVYVVGLYLATERKWRWHDAQEFENRFWTVTAFLFSTAVVYAKDSPIALGQYSSSAGAMLVLMFTLAVQFYDRRLHRLQISRKPQIRSMYKEMNNPKRNSGGTGSAPALHYQYKATAPEKTKVLNACLEQIDRMYLPSTINHIINMNKVKRQEQKIIRILSSASKDELNYIVGHIRLALLCYKVKDHTSPTEQHRSMILELFCRTRLVDLSTTSRAILLDALMVMKISAHKSCEANVRNIILRTYRDELSLLKTSTDGKADIHSMHKLIFGDIRSDRIRSDILNHIKQQAAIQAAHMKLGTKTARSRKQKAWRKVLSDVDDTLYSSGGHYPAGMDTSYPRKTIYPGVLSFYRELDLGMTNSSETGWIDGEIGNLVFLSARPHVYKDLSEKKSYQKFQSLYEDGGMHTLPTLLAGSIESGRAFMLQGNLEPMALKKYDNFCEYHQLYPEFTHIFIGDNGQGDVRAAELIVDKLGTGVLESAYFHLVQPIEKTFGYKSESTIQEWKTKNIYFFHTYVGAAVIAYENLQLTHFGLHRIARESREQFLEIQRRFWSKPISEDTDYEANHAQHEQARHYLNQDLAKANVIFRKTSMSVIEFVSEVQHFPVDTHVMTPFGDGFVTAFRPQDGVFSIELVHRPDQNQRVFVQQRDVALYTNQAPISKHHQLHEEVFATGVKIATAFGDGFVRGYSRKRRLYEIELPHLGTEQSVVFYSSQHHVDGFLRELKTRQERSGSFASPMLSGMRSSLTFLTSYSFKSTGPDVDSNPFDLDLISTAPLYCPKYPIHAYVQTQFGNGEVLAFDEETNCYHVKVNQDKTSPLMYHCRENMLTWRRKGLLNQPIATAFGTGILLQIREYDGMHVVQIRQLDVGQMTCYLHPEKVFEVIPAAVGDHVKTKYGKGIVVNYRRHANGFRDYAIALDWTMDTAGCTAQLFIQPQDVERLPIENEEIESRCDVM